MDVQQKAIDNLGDRQTKLESLVASIQAGGAPSVASGPGSGGGAGGATAQQAARNMWRPTFLEVKGWVKDWRTL
eukprot:6408838-Pyramimonas_sp.AAC.1